MTSERITPIPISEYSVRMDHITRRFPGVLANDNVHLYVRRGSFHALVGENGAGKSTLLNILYGRLRADQGTVLINGEDVTESLHTPADALKRGVALVSQHYALIPALTVLENIMLGSEDGALLRKRRASEKVLALSSDLGLQDIPINACVEQLSVAASQKVEILKALYRGANLLLLDEPTATLAPQEAEGLFALLQRLQLKGATIVFVTHKLQEVMSYSQYVSVLSSGRNAGDFKTAETSMEELLTCMLGAGQRRENISTNTSSRQSTPEKTGLKSILSVEMVTVKNARGAVAVRDVNINIAPGEIVGVAGVDGSGQKELSEAIMGLRRVDSGRIILADNEVTNHNVSQRLHAGIAYISEDRHKAGMVTDMTVAENYLLGHEGFREWGGGAILNENLMNSRAAKMLMRYSVKASGAGALARTLSGGNQQKVVVARALDSSPKLLVASQPTRGLDVSAAEFVYRSLRLAREEGAGILLFSLDLDEIMQLADKIAVMFNGRIAGILQRSEATQEKVGALMTGAEGILNG